MALTARQIILLLLLRRRMKRKNTRVAKRRFWVRQIYKERKIKGEYHLLVQDLKLFDRELFFRHFRMTPSKLEELLGYVGPLITKSSLKREAISASERLCFTMRYLVTGDAQTTIADSYRMGKNTVSGIVKQTANAIWESLVAQGFLQAPSTEKEWIKIADDFEKRWNFGNCVGAIDGKHVVMKGPARSGSYFFNYKKTHSIVLLAVVYSNYEYILVDIGDAGRQSDALVFASSHLGHAIEENLLNIPKSRPLRNTSKEFPFVFVGDKAFPLKEYLIKPYTRGFIKKKSKLRITVCQGQEDKWKMCLEFVHQDFAFFEGLLSPMWTLVAITKAVVVLHNFLMFGKTFDREYCPGGYAEQELWRQDIETEGLRPIPKAGSNNYSRYAKEIRDDFRDYFYGPGAVPWQWDHISRTVDPFDEDH